MERGARVHGGGLGAQAVSNTTRYLPEAQTGLYFFGKALLRQTVVLEYGLTLSNGRGPTVEVYDLDENKALGAKLQISHDGPVSVTAGTYLYTGEYTDTTRSLNLSPGLDFVESITEKYKEKVFSLHLKLDFFGVLLQGEYVRGLVEYIEENRGVMNYLNNTLYTPDHIRQGAYALIGYMLPLKRFQLQIRTVVGDRLVVFNGGRDPFQRSGGIPGRHRRICIRSIRCQQLDCAGAEADLSQTVNDVAERKCNYLCERAEQFRGS